MLKLMKKKIYNIFTLKIFVYKISVKTGPVNDTYVFSQGSEDLHNQSASSHTQSKDVDKDSAQTYGF